MHRLPEQLPATPDVLWSVPLTAGGLGGVAATHDRIIVSDRELNDTTDAWKCFSSEGKLLWSVRNPAPGNLDYGNSPRATPVIQDGRVYLSGAFGHLTCVTLAKGAVEWETNLRDEFEPDDSPKWGACSTPLVLDGRVIVNPGAKAASLAALDAKTGKLLWKTPGKAAGYGSLIAATVRGKTQIVGHDTATLGGWDPATGERLWSLLPEKAGDFNVPTPIALDDKLVVITENNGTRLYDYDDSGKLVPKPLAVNRRLVPDTHSPIVVGNRVLGVWRRLYCLDLGKNLKELWSADDQAFTKYCAIVSDGTRALVIGMAGELILLDALADRYQPLGKLKALDSETGLYSHPAFVGGRIYLRGSASLTASRLES